MGGFLVPVQPFGVYQALDWLVRDDTSVDNVIRALERIRSVIEKGRADEIIKLNIVSRLIECLETTQCKRLQVPRNIEAYPSIEIIFRFILPGRHYLDFGKHCSWQVSPNEARSPQGIKQIYRNA